MAAFSLANPIPPENLRRAMNRLLPHAIRVLSAEEVHTDFHPRFEAKAKTYEYRIVRGEVCSPSSGPTCSTTLTRWTRTAWCNWRAPSRASTISPPSPPPTTAMPKAIRRCGPFSRRFWSAVAGRLIYRVRGSGFLKHMVRNIVGTLIEAGKGNIADCGVLPEKCGPTVPAQGLFLVSVEYD